MAFLNWSDEYSVNIKEIDRQHMQLLELINNLHSGMKEGKGKAILGSVLDELVKYTEYHFDFEEKLFTKHGYPEAASHKNLHVDLVKKVIQYKTDFDSGKTVLTMEILNFLKEWLLKHIANSDKKYSVYLKSKGVV